MEKYKIYSLLVFVMFVWGLNVIATKIIVTTFAPVTITSFRIFVAGLSVFIILSLMKKVRIPTKSEFIYVLLGSLFNVVLHQYFLSIGLTSTTASNTGLILGLGPLLTTIAAFIFLGTKITYLRLTGVFLGLIGVSFVVLKGQTGIAISIGDLNVFLSILAQAVSFVIIKKVSSSLDPRLMTGYMLLIGSFFLFIIGLFKEPNGLEALNQGSPEIWTIFFASAIISTALGHMIYNYSIGKVGVSESAIFINLNPFFALISAVVFLGEEIALSQIIGFLFILFGVLFGSGAVEDFLRKTKTRTTHAIRVKKVS